MLMKYFLGVAMLVIIGASVSVFIDGLIDQIFDRK